MKYAGVGARKAPSQVLVRAKKMAEQLAAAGYQLRTGGARGADSAFLAGALAAGDAVVDPRAVVYLPWEGYNKIEERPGMKVVTKIVPEAFELASRAHPSWRAVKAGARKLHARNAQIILGASLRDPVDFVVCWTEGGEVKGGTGVAMEIARRYGVPCFNLWDTDVSRVLEHALAK